MAMDAPRGTEQQVPLFSVFNLMLLALCLGVAVALVSAGARTGSLFWVGVSVLLAIMLVPVVFVVGTYAIVICLALLIFVSHVELAAPTWLGRVRTVLRGSIAAGTVIWVIMALPGIWSANTTSARKEALLLGVLLPLSILFFLFVLPRFERLDQHPQATADPPGADHAPGDP
jgi:hypothetical protein